MKVVFTYGGPNPYRPEAEALISLVEYSNNEFVVNYGKLESEILDYRIAAHALGECLMHHLILNPRGFGPTIESNHENSRPG